MNTVEIANVIREIPLPDGISLYELQGKILFELRNSQGFSTNGIFIAYLVTRDPDTKFSLEFPDNVTSEQIKINVQDGILKYQADLQKYLSSCEGQYFVPEAIK